jgi:photosystem II stability/assembly factor-like uncharacterized protein
MKIPFGKPFPGIDPTSLRDNVAAGLVNGYINELDDYQLIPGLTLFGTFSGQTVPIPQSRFFDGIDDRLDTGLNQHRGTTDNVTAYAWIKKPSETGSTVLGLINAFSPFQRLDLYCELGSVALDYTLNLTLKGKDGNTDFRSVRIHIGIDGRDQCIFIAAVNDVPNNRCRFFWGFTAATVVEVDVSDFTTPITAIAFDVGTTANCNINIGALGREGSSAQNFFHGFPSGVGLEFDTVLTLAEVQDAALGLRTGPYYWPVHGETPEPGILTIYGTTVLDNPPCGVTAPAETFFPIDALYESLNLNLYAVINGAVLRVNSDGTFTALTGDTVTADTYYYWAEDGQHIYLAHGGKLARIDETNLTVTLLNENTPSAVTHVVRSKGFLLCNGNDRIMSSSPFELAQTFDTSDIFAAVTVTDRAGWILMAGGIQGSPGQGRIFLSKDNGISWTKAYESSGVLGNEAVLSLCYMGGGVVLAGTAGFDPGFSFNLGRILRSANYGESWSVIGELGTNVRIPVIAKIQTGVAIAGGTDLFRTVDNGLTWTTVSSPASFPSEVAAPIVLNSTTVFVGAASGGNAHIWKSVDAGENFTDAVTLGPGSVVSGVKVSATVALVGVRTIDVGILGKIYRTIDAGVTWTDLGDIGLTDGMVPVEFLLTSQGDLVFVASGNDDPSQLWKSTDNGVIWSQVSEFDSGDGVGSVIEALAETHTEGQLLAAGRLSFSAPHGADTAAKWQMGIGKNAPQGDVFYSEDISNNYEAVDSWERFNAQSVPDEVNGVFENRGLVYTPGPKSIEINYNSSDPAFPWAVSDPSLPYGLGAPFSWVNWDDLNAVMYLSCTDRIWEVVKFQGRTQQNISQVYASILNDRTLITSPQTAKAWGINLRGMPFYVLTFQDDNLTIVYNLLKDHWFRWGIWNGTDYESAAIINAYVYSRALNKHLVGDRRATGKIFEIRGTAEDGQDMCFDLTSGHVAAGNWGPKPVGRVMFKCKRGAAIDSSEPVFTYATRDNGNQTFGTARSVSLGFTNDTELFGQLNRCGMYHTRQHRIRYVGSKTDFIFAQADES